MKYPHNSIKDNRERRGSQNNKVSKYLLIGVFITIALLVYLIIMYLIIKFDWIRWTYVALSIALLIGFGIYKLLFRVTNAQTSHSDTSRESELELEVESLKVRNQSLNRTIEVLNGKINDEDNEIAHLKQQLENIIKEYRLENKYSDLMRFLQKLNKYIDDEKIDKDFAANIREYISSVLNTYGYRIVEYSPETTYSYEEEICSVSSPELVRRAIIDSKGNVVLKGKIYLNSNGQ